jgi:hypothetical protein
MTRDEVIHKAKELVNTYPSYFQQIFIYLMKRSAAI